MFSGITIVCFTASYAVSLALEVTRLFFRVSVRMVLILAFASAGLLAHGIHLVMYAGQQEFSSTTSLYSWYTWCLAAAWGVAAVYLLLAIRRPQAAVGIFLLPLVLALLGLGWLFRELPPFVTDDTTSFWAFIHGQAWLLGTVVVVIGFSAGLMYLVQVFRLKHKLPPRQGLRLPSLEWLGRVNETALVISTFALAIGLVSGIFLNLSRPLSPDHGLAWTDPVVWSAAVLLLWLVIALVFNAIYKPARQGRKVAYLTVASFIFLVLALTMALLARHASSRNAFRKSFRGDSDRVAVTLHAACVPRAERDTGNALPPARRREKP